MGYAIEMSHKIDKCNKVTNIEFIGNYIYNRAFNSESYYSINEPNINTNRFTKNKKNKKNKKNIIVDNIHVVIYSETNFNEFLKFVRQIQSDKLVTIDCVYQDDITGDILYTSPHYLKKTNKNFIKTYNINNINNIIKNNSNNSNIKNEILKMLS